MLEIPEVIRATTWGGMDGGGGNRMMSAITCTERDWMR